jgi:hypothetical protein
MRRTQLLKVGVVGVLAVGLAVAVTVACSGPAGTPYGNPNTLDRKNIPGEGGVEPLTCTLSADAGLKDAGGGCGVSFAADIYPYFADAGGCAQRACHGAGSKNPPAIDVSTPAALYASLKTATAANLPYLPSGAADAAAPMGDGGGGGGTSLVCNLRGQCGRKMPEGTGKDPSPDDLCRMQTWVNCGAPNN